MTTKQNLVNQYALFLASVKEADYTPGSWKTYAAVVAANKVTSKTKKDDIEQAIVNITTAQARLVPAVDLTRYRHVCNSVMPADYTSTSWAKYSAVVGANVMTSANTQEQVDLATAKIETAQKNLLEKKPNDLSGYQAALNSVNKDEFTDASWVKYQAVVAANVVTTATPQAEIDLATANIIAAQGSLVKLTDLSAYQAVTGAVAESNYTHDSWSTYQRVVGTNFVTNQDSQNKVDKATNCIRMAQSTILVPLSNLTAYESATGQVKAQKCYTKASWDKYQLALGGNVVSPQNTQAEVDEATAKILAAQKELREKHPIPGWAYTLIACFFLVGMNLCSSPTPTLQPVAKTTAQKTPPTAEKPEKWLILFERNGKPQQQEMRVTRTAKTFKMVATIDGTIMEGTGNDGVKYNGTMKGGGAPDGTFNVKFLSSREAVGAWLIDVPISYTLKRLD